MKIGIDISQIIYGTGVSNYTRNLVTALLKLDKQNEYVLFGGTLRRTGELQDFHARLSSKNQLKIFPFSPTIADFIWNRLHILPIENFVGNVDVFHSSDWAQPPKRRAKLVTTIHDLVPVLYPESSHPKIVAVHKRRLVWVKKEVDHIITVSNATKQDIVNHLGIPPEKVSVVAEAPDPEIKKMDEARVGEFLKEHNLPKEYVLVVGADLRKNIARISEATQKASKRLPLIVVGRKWGNADITSHNIHWVGHVSLEILSALYSGAQVLVYASLYEGFGLPILNAFVCGIPVVTSSISSMPEVAGNAAVLVDPRNIDDIAAGIQKAIATRSDLVKKGKIRAKQFSWEKAARATLKVYEEVTA